MRDDVTGAINVGKNKFGRSILSLMCAEGGFNVDLGDVLHEVEGAVLCEDADCNQYVAFAHGFGPSCSTFE